MSNQKPKAKKPDVSSDDDIEIGGDVADSFIIHGDGNVINVIEKKDTSDLPEKGPDSKNKINIAIIVALIGLIGTIGAALIGTYGKRDLPAPSPTLIPTTAIAFTDTATPTFPPTNTALPDTPTSTPVLVTDTPVPTITPIPQAIGVDWLAGCISTLWRAYPSVPTDERGDGCWREPVYVFSAENGDLDFLAERKGGFAETYGLFAPLPESGTVTFTVRLEHLENADLWMGVFAEPNLDSKGLLLTILNGNVNKRSIVQKDPRTYETIQGTQVLSQGNGFLISFTVTPLSVSSRVNPHVFVWDPVSLPSPQKWIFLGYKGLRNTYHIEGTFLNFELK